MFKGLSESVSSQSCWAGLYINNTLEGINYCSSSLVQPSVRSIYQLSLDSAIIPDNWRIANLQVQERGSWIDP